ncbi:uncharacterized protein LOC142632511 [Castanea sativa]|uniref:uncharacterized protein LOC142632511 n=1 Tax=Castanea sativa TaxID=21020 RepID=UPI003F6503A5
MWLSDGGCSQTVKDAWGHPSTKASMALVAGKLKNCGEKLLSWSRQSFGNIKKAIELKSKRLNKAELEAAKGKGEANLIGNLKAELNDLLDKESQMWRQRSRALFLKEGDRNTRYFHSKASKRFCRNRMLGLRNESNVWCTDDSQIKEISIQYYQTLFATSHPTEFDAILETVFPSVTQEMNAQLLRPFTREKIEIAIKQMEPIMAPGPDGMPPLFYQSFWSLVGDKVCSAVLDCLNNCKIPHEINHTNITLIPKVKSPENITEFRPISLCNVIYKLVSKVLANRLKVVLPAIVSENQSAFQAGRVITDNVLMAFETLHYMKNHQSGKSGFMALKLDMNKAYDRVEWLYLEKIMRKMGFDEKWVALMMECTTSVSYSILINGVPTDVIHPSRGIRQGSILEAKEGKGSFAWKSILKGREIIQKGLLWRVGNGSSIRIFHDNWLPDPSIKKILSKPLLLDSQDMVSSLIDWEKHCWSRDVIDANFSPREATTIKAIPLSLSYQQLLDLELNEQPSTSDLSSTKQLWNGIWKLRVPNRVKTLIWRTSTNSLPSKVWSVNFGWLLSEAGKATCFLDVLKLCSERSNLVDMLAMTVAQIWTRRNKLRVGDDVPPLGLINQLALVSLQEFHQSSLNPPKAPLPPKDSKWLPPPTNWVKVNFDGATFGTSSSAGLGVIIRNDLGLVMAAFTQPIPLPTSVEMVDVLAARSALCFAKDLGFTKLVVEGDSKIAIQALTNDSLSSSCFGHIIKDIKRLSSTLESVIFSHTRRQGNEVAHGMARMACNFSLFQSWMEDVPSGVKAVYLSEIPQ